MQGVLPPQEVVRGGVDAAVGLSGKEGLLAVVALCPVYSLAVNIVVLHLLTLLGIVAVAAAHLGVLVHNVAVRHVGNLGIRGEILHVFHPCAVKDVLLLEVNKSHPSLLFHKQVKQVERGVDVFIGTAWLKVQRSEVFHVLNALLVGSGEHEVTVVARTRVGNARTVAEQVAQFHLLPDVAFELRKVAGNTAVEVDKAHLLHLQRANGGELLADAGDVKRRVAVNLLASGHVGDAYALVIYRLAIFGNEQGGAWRLSVVVRLHHRVEPCFQPLHVHSLCVCYTPTAHSKCYCYYFYCCRFHY